jgi:hypothetical protein
MVGRVNVKASQHNKKPIVVHIDRVLDLTRPEVKRKRQKTIIASGSTSKQNKNGQDWTGNER